MVGVGELPPGLLPHDGSWAAWLGGVTGETAYIQQRASVPRTRPMLTYWHLVRPAPGCSVDRASVIVNSATVMRGYSLCTSTPNGQWQQFRVDLSRFAGQSVLIQIRAETAASASSLFVDDITFEE